MLKDKIRGSLIGGAIGDALGYQIEFERGIKERQITRFAGTPQIVSDDTQMTLFTASGIIYAKKHDVDVIQSIYEAYLDWLDTQYYSDDHESICWIKEVEELNHGRAPGNTCLTSLLSGSMGTLEKPINNSKGCGGIMRIAPIGLSYDNPRLAGMLGAQSNAITHGHQLSIISSFVCSAMISYLTYSDISIEEALNKAIELLKDNLETNYTDDFIDLVNKAVKLSKENIHDLDAIKQLGEGWVAEETFAISLYSCLKHQDNFKEAVICAVNHDGDSDSTGAVTGNILGAYLGYEAIPSEYKDNVELKDVILKICDELMEE